MNVTVSTRKFALSRWRPTICRRKFIRIWQCDQFDNILTILSQSTRIWKRFQFPLTPNLFDMKVWEVRRPKLSRCFSSDNICITVASYNNEGVLNNAPHKYDVCIHFQQVIDLFDDISSGGDALHSYFRNASSIYHTSSKLYTRFSV